MMKKVLEDLKWFRNTAPSVTVLFLKLEKNLQEEYVSSCLKKKTDA